MKPLLIFLIVSLQFVVKSALAQSDSEKVFMVKKPEKADTSNANPLLQNSGNKVGCHGDTIPNVITTYITLEDAKKLKADEIFTLPKSYRIISIQINYCLNGEYWIYGGYLNDSHCLDKLKAAMCKGMYFCFGNLLVEKGNKTFYMDDPHRIFFSKRSPIKAFQIK